MFLTEKELKETFWKYYNYSGRALYYQFECPIREGNADLVTIEKFQGNVQFNAFEFKLSDISKALLQAKANCSFVHKSWIVIPSEKEQLIKERYLNTLEKTKTVGVISVEEAGRWNVVFQPKFQNDVSLSQVILNMMIN